MNRKHDRNTINETTFNASLKGWSRSCSPLQWDKTEATLNTAAGETRAEAVFILKNNSDKPVTILRMEMDCSCLQESTGIIGRPIEAKASSRMVIAFTPGLLTKAGDHKIAIHTDLQAEPSVITVHTRFSSLITLEPEVPSWKQGEAPMEKFILIKSVKDLEIKGLQSTSSDFESRLETVEAGRQWRLFIRPMETNATRVPSSCCKPAGPRRPGVSCRLRRRSCRSGEQKGYAWVF